MLSAFKAHCVRVMDRLGGRVLVFVGLIFLVGWLGLSFLVSSIHQQLIMSQNERSVLLVTQAVAKGLMTIMLAGDAKIAQDYSRVSSKSLRRDHGLTLW